MIDAGDGKNRATKGEGPASIEHVTVEEKEFYEFDITRSLPKGFGVQVGTYQELVNLMRLSDNLKTLIKNVLVQVKVINGVKYYSLILGPLPSRPKAADLLTEVKRNFPIRLLLTTAAYKMAIS